MDNPVGDRSMRLIPEGLQKGYLKLVAPLVRWLVAKDVSPNLITLIGAGFWVLGGIFYGAGYISAGGWLLGITALFDVVDGQVARASGRISEFGAFFDSTLDRIADGCVMGGLAFFYATSAEYHNPTMVATCIVCLIGTFLISYTRARAEGLGLKMKVGMMQRPERVILLSAPQAFFGMALDGMVLSTIVVLLTATAWITVGERMGAVYRASHSRRAAAGALADPSAQDQPRLEVRSPGSDAD